MRPPLSSLAIEVARHRMNELSAELSDWLSAELEAALDCETFDPMIIGL